MKVIITIFIIYAIIVTYMATYQRKMMYFPAVGLENPASYGLHDVSAGKLQTSDGESLDYWYAAAKNDMPTILYFHGNGGHIGYRADFIRAAQDQGFGIFLPSYRGYGSSTGHPTEKGLYEDARTAYEHLTEQEGIAKDRLIIYGESIGSAVAIELARKKDVAALALQAPFTSAVSIAKRIYFWLPVSLVMQDRYESIKKVDDIHAPVMVFAAQNDRITGLDEAKKLYDALQQPKKIIVFEHIGHNEFNAQRVLIHLRYFYDNER